ncbi:MAG: DUF2760 domain-containing protein [Pseudomonadota bacterium]|nr:DUF2760 domain-containing protein [Pseudomonadota bacterium]
MSDQELSFFSRLMLAFAAFWRAVTDPDFAAGVDHLLRGEPSAPRAEPAPPAPGPPPLRETNTDSALQLLGLFQQEGRLVDFLKEDVGAYSDADIGGAARVVHEGCRKTLIEHLHIVPVRSEDEGIRITLEEGFDASETRLTGNVVGKPPFSGTLMHRGWRVSGVNLPKLAEGHEVRVLAPAEVEL